MKLSDGTNREFTPNEAALASSCANVVGIARGDLRMQNDWLREQLRCPWRIENYREACKTPSGTRRAIGATA